MAPGVRMEARKQLSDRSSRRWCIARVIFVTTISMPAFNWVWGRLIGKLAMRANRLVVIKPLGILGGVEFEPECCGGQDPEINRRGRRNERARVGGRLHIARQNPRIDARVGYDHRARHVTAKVGKARADKGVQAACRAGIAARVILAHREVDEAQVAEDLVAARDQVSVYS